MIKRVDEFNPVRRAVLRVLGLGASFKLLGLGAAAAAGSDARQAQCVVRPRQAEGPYFLDQMLHRSDIRRDPTDGSVRPGMPLELTLHINRITDGLCLPLEGAVVDIWHCDAGGVYSGFKDFNDQFDTRGHAFLRGYQISDSEGVVRFQTIYPGWYSGRAVHIHFKIRTEPGSDAGMEFTSQMYFDDSITDQVLALEPYVSGDGRRRNSEDGLYRRGGSQLMLSLEPMASGYRGEFTIGLELPA